LNPVTSTDRTSVNINANANLELVEKFYYSGDKVTGWRCKIADAAVEDRVQIGLNKFRHLLALLANRDISLIIKKTVHQLCVK